MDMDSDPCHCIATDTDMALSGNLSWDMTMAPVGGTGHSQQAPPPPWSLQFHNKAQAAPLLFLPHATRYLHIVMVATTGWLQLVGPRSHPPSVLCSMTTSGCLWPACAVRWSAGLRVA